jgi:hypothetical protein
MRDLGLDAKQGHERHRRRDRDPATRDDLGRHVGEVSQLEAALGGAWSSRTRHEMQCPMYWFGVNETALVEGYADER